MELVNSCVLEQVFSFREIHTCLCTSLQLEGRGESCIYVHRNTGSMGGKQEHCIRECYSQMKVCVWSQLLTFCLSSSFDLYRGIILVEKAS